MIFSASRLSKQRICSSSESMNEFSLDKAVDITLAIAWSEELSADRHAAQNRRFGDDILRFTLPKGFHCGDNSVTRPIRENLRKRGCGDYRRQLPMHTVRSVREELSAAPANHLALCSLGNLSISIWKRETPFVPDGASKSCIVNKYMDAYISEGKLEYKAKSEKFAKITAKTIISADGDTASMGQNARPCRTLHAYQAVRLSHRQLSVSRDRAAEKSTR